jgi:hypothetical protein
MELPFAVESPERTSQLLSSGDDSSLVTTSSQGSFLSSSSVAASMHPQQHHQQPASINQAMTSATATVPHTTSPSFVHTMQPHPSSHPPSNRHLVVNRATLTGAVVAAPPLPASVSRPSSTTSSGITSGITSGLNIFGNLRVFGSSSSKKQTLQPTQAKANTETIDFTYVTVSETDADEVDITLEGNLMAIDGNYGGPMGSEENNSNRGDILTLLLSGAVQQQQDGDSDNESLVVGNISLKGRVICQLDFDTQRWTYLFV